MINLDKTLELGRRIYNNKMIEQKDETGKITLSDTEAIKAFCEKAFYANGEVRNLEDYRSFNRLIVQVAELEAQAKIEPIIKLISNFSTADTYDVKMYEIPRRTKVTMALTASGSGVDFQRIPLGKSKYPAKPDKHQFGAKYNVSEMISDPVNGFKKAVDYVVEYKFKYIFNKLMTLTRNAKALNKIPTAQWLESANISFMDFRKLENTLLRYGNGVKPVMIADRNLIDSFAIKEMTTSLNITGKEGILATDELREKLLRGTEFSQVSRTICMPTDNPFVDNMNSKVDLPVNEGIVLAGGDKSPFYITEYGSMRIAQDLPDIENEEVHMKIDMKMDISLLVGQAMAYVKDTAVVL